MLNFLKKHWLGLAISILIAEVTGILSALLAGPMKESYKHYILPPLSPPSWIFALVWPILYALMGTAAYLIYSSQAEKGQKNKALILYTIQLFINFTWSIVFFRWEMLWGAVLVVLLLDAFVIATIIAFKKIRPTAALLMLPYLLWILFATYLNIAIALAN